MKKVFVAIAILALLVVGATAVLAQSTGTYNSTITRVNIGVATKTMFGFGPVSNPIIGQTVVFVGCTWNGSSWGGSYTVLTNYAKPGQQSSGAIPLTCDVFQTLHDPDGDSNKYTSVVVTSAQSGQVGSQTVTLNSASFQSEQTGMHNQNETLGGSAQITVQ